MARRPCLHPGCPHLTDGQARCRQHERHNTTVWRTTSRDILGRWRATHGDWCPGWRRPPHHSTDLTVHHTDRPQTPYVVLCRACNAAAG